MFTSISQFSFTTEFISDNLFREQMHQMQITKNASHAYVIKTEIYFRESYPNLKASQIGKPKYQQHSTPKTYETFHQTLNSTHTSEPQTKQQRDSSTPKKHTQP